MEPPKDLESYLEYLRQNQTDLFHMIEKLMDNIRDVYPNNDTRNGISNNPVYGIPADTENSPDSISYHDPTLLHPPLTEDIDELDNPTSEILQNNVITVCANSTLVLNYFDLTQIPSIRYIFIVIYILVIVISFIGNFMVIWTVTRNRHMRTVTNYYIRNLAVCDFLVAGLVMPLKLLEYTAPCSWQVFAKDALCSVIYYILPVFVFASVLTLVAISLERYEILFSRCHAIVYPFNSLTMHSKTRTRLILTATWLVPIIVASPYMYCKGYAFSIQSSYGTVSRQICTDRFAEIDAALYGEEHKNSGRFRKGFFIFISITMYMVPMIVIVTTCIRIARCLLKPMETEPQEQSSYGIKMTRKRGESKRRVARMIITVAIAFILCWTPFYLVTFISQVQKVSFLLKSNFLFTMLATHLLGFLNSAINPFIYHFMSEKFRKSFTIMGRSLFCWCPNLLTRRKKENTSERYSWAMKCEEYYCQHRLQKQQQQHSSSSHSHSKNDYVAHNIMTAKFKNNVYDEEGSSSLIHHNSPQRSQKASQNTTPNKYTHEEQRMMSKSPKDVTIVKNKKSTLLYCGPFCVCQCQGCSLQSSSSTTSSLHRKPYCGGKQNLEVSPFNKNPDGDNMDNVPSLSECSLINKNGKLPQTVDTVTDTSLSITRNEKYKKHQFGGQKKLKYIELNGQNGEVKFINKQCSNIEDELNTSEIIDVQDKGRYFCNDSCEENNLLLCKKNTSYSRSEGMINFSDGTRNCNPPTKVSRSSNHLVI